MIKSFSSLDKTHCQKVLSLKIPYFVTEVISGRKCINFFTAECIQLNSMELMSFFGITPKQNLIRTSIFCDINFKFGTQLG